MKQPWMRIVSGGIFIFFIVSAHSLYTSAKELSVLTFNVWMVKKLGQSISSKLEDERLPLIADKIMELQPDIVAIQEIWSFGLRNKLIQLMKRDYPYSYHRNLWGMGDGMLVLSKHPIVPGSEHTFADGTAIEEWHFITGIGVQKGVFRLTINVSGTDVDVFPFHLGAVYFSKEINDYDASEVSGRHQQANELRDFVQEFRRNAIPTLVLGDLNSHFFDWDKDANTRVRNISYEYRQMTEVLGLQDSYMTANQIDLSKDPMASLDLATFDTTKNIYAAKGFFGDLPKEFIDYIFFAPGNNGMTLVSSKMVFTEKLNPNSDRRMPVHLSDHWGILSTFNLQ